MVVAVLIIALDQYLQARKYPFRVPILAVAIGFYLPFQLSVPIFVGGLDQRWPSRDTTEK